MVHCIHRNQHNHQQNKKESNYLDIDEVADEMILLTTKDSEEINTANQASTKNTTPVNKTVNSAEQQTQDKKLKSQAFSVLSYDQVKRLHDVIEQVIPIHGRGNFPTLDIKLKDLVKIVRTKLEVEQSIRINDIRLNGGAASYVLLPENSTYNDVDLIFAVDLSDAKSFEKIRTAVLDSLLEFFPEGAMINRISSCTLKDAYIHKMVKVSEKVDKWSLISLSNNSGRNVELKFVDTMQRQFEFSVDSFHIILDSLIRFYECSEKPISENIYPTVITESVYGDFNEAFSHLENKIIATRRVEQIRGGGLLKYCNLLIRNYIPSDNIKTLERYMCSRFFIDFNDIQSQRNKLESYLANHFNNDDWTKTQYLMQLYKVVDDSTVCLMQHERRQTLALIEEMAYHFYLMSTPQTTSPTTQHCSPHHYSVHFPHIGKQASTQYFPHIHHHLIRPHHPHFDLIVASQQQTTTPQSKQSNQPNDSNKKASSSTNGNNATTTAINSNSSNTAKINHNSSSAQSAHSNNHTTSNSDSNSTSKNSTKNQQHSNQHSSQQSQQHIQQQYHAYLFGTGANTYFHYNPYHHSMHHQAHNGCFNSMSCQSCQCGLNWMACA